jgi:ornithine cyclodeaminase/alanine dehydrogenase-like protein (mu-crystallin family)
LQDILIISQNEAEKCLPMKDAIEAVKTAYIAFSAGRVQMPPVVHLDVKMYNGEVDIKSGYIEDLNLIGTKIASGYYDNHKLGLPPGIGVIVNGWDIHHGLKNRCCWCNCCKSPR